MRNFMMSRGYSLPNIIQVMKSRRMRRPGHVARMKEMGNA
jgi:hypothetical protein